jgi:hypothetical protein
MDVLEVPRHFDHLSIILLAKVRYYWNTIL